MSILGKLHDWIRGENTFKTRSVRELLEQAQAEAKFSPDMMELEDYLRVGLFVHDELKTEKKLFDDFEAEHYASAFTKQPFSFWKKVSKYNGERGIALVTPQETIALPLPIRGELYRVVPDLLLDVLDKRYKNLYDFKRIRVTLLIPSIEQVWDRASMSFIERTTVRKLRAHMYIGVNDIWQPQLENTIQSISNGFGKTKIKIGRGMSFDKGYFKPVDVCHPKQKEWSDYYNFYFNGG